MSEVLEKKPALEAMRSILQNSSIEITSNDRKSLNRAPEVLRAGQKVFVANLPKDTLRDMLDACVRLCTDGLDPVPHIVARNISDEAELERSLEALSKKAGVKRALVLGGDRDEPQGDYDYSLQLIDTGAFERNGIDHLYLACYPEGHPRISEEQLAEARLEKMMSAERRGLGVTFVGQFAFESKPIIALVRRLREEGIKAPIRPGLAGPAKRSTLIKYGMMCGVGTSLRAMKERDGFAKNLLSQEAPDRILQEIVEADLADPRLKIEGIHFFTFGSILKTADWMDTYFS